MIIMSNSVAARFDAVPFEGWCSAQTHPDHLATLAFLMGLTPSPVEHCGILELGCGMGANPAALAATLPSWILQHSRRTSNLKSRRLTAPTDEHEITSARRL
jgi:hypothetical protein